MDESKPQSWVRRFAVASLGLTLMSAFAGCGSFYGTTAASYLRRIKENPDPNDRYKAYELLASPRCYDDEQQKARAVDVMIGKLQGDAEPSATRAIICRTLGELHDPRSRDALRKAADDPDPLIRAEAYRALGKVGTAEDAVKLAAMMSTDTQIECRIAATEGIGQLRSADERIYDTLLRGMEHDDPAIRYASLQSLRNVTGMDMGVDPEAWRPKLQQLAARPAETAPTRRR